MKKTILAVAIGAVFIASSPNVNAACVNNSGDGVNYTCVGTSEKFEGTFTSSSSITVENAASINEIIINQKNDSTEANINGSIINNNSLIGNHTGLTITNNEEANAITINEANTGYISASSVGIDVINNGNGISSISIAGSVIGQNSTGISVKNNGVGKIDIETSGIIYADIFKENGVIYYGEYDGIDAIAMSDISIKQIGGEILGGTNGIYATTESGSGSINFTQTAGIIASAYHGLNTITNTGNINIKQIEGSIFGSSLYLSSPLGDGSGIYALTSSGAIAITQEGGTIAGNSGIYVDNFGTGSTTISLAGEVRGTEGNGVYALTSGALTIIQENGSITGNSGVYIKNNGSDLINITMAGVITGNKEYGIYTATETGNISITQTMGSIVGAKYGIYAKKSSLDTGSDINIIQTSGEITGSTGIYVDNSSNASTSIVTAGSVIGTESYGIYAESTIDLIIEQTAGTIIGGTYGIYADNQGEGVTSIITKGNITGNDGDGISVSASNSTSTNITQSSGVIIGTQNGMNIEHYNSNDINVNISGTIIGGTGAGIYAIGDQDQTLNITLNDKANVSATSGIAIQDNSGGNAIVTLKSGSKVSGKILLGKGSGSLTINQGADITEVTEFNGGTSLGIITDTGILNINQSLTGSSDNSTSGVAGDIYITNWDQINIGSNDNNATDVTVSLSNYLQTNNNITINSNGIINLAATLTETSIEGNVINAGIIDLSSNNTTGDILTIDGNYVGSGGTLILDTTLGDDSSVTDKLVIMGDASGTTYVTINNIGGTGAQTVEGIEIVEVAGESSGAFVKNGRIVAGSYEYDVVKGNVSGTDTNNWYLTSAYVEPTPTPTPEPIPDSNNTKKVSVIRPEAGSYIANLASANTLFNTTLHDRLGETQYTDFLTGEKLVTSMWLRSQIGRHNFLAGSGQLKNKTNWSLVQLGGDIVQWSSNDTNRLHLGVMAGFGRSSSDTHARLSGYSAKGSIDGYSLGLYGTWYDNDVDKSGLYVDSWVLWNHFNAKVHGQELDREKYKLKGITASIESGYTFKLGGSEFYNYWLQPKAQVTYMGVDADNHTESNGTKVKADANNWQSRLGLRLSANTNDLFNSKNSSAGQLFIEANWVHNTQPFSVKMDDSRVSQDGARNIVEIKTGVETNILTNTNVWFNLAYQRGDNSYSNFSGILGVKYSF